MKKNIYIISLLFLISNSIVAQTEGLKLACNDLKKSLYDLPFEYESVKSNLVVFQEKLKNSSELEYIDCNCADTLWSTRNAHKYSLVWKTHSTDLDTIQFLNSISHDIDHMNLAHEFKLEEIQNAKDSLDFVLNRLNLKYSRNKFIYNLINAEVEYLKREKYKLLDSYLEVVDDSIYQFEIEDALLLSLFNSNDLVEKKIKQRIGIKEHEQHFYRMYGVINTSSSKKIPENQLEILENINYDIGKEKIEFLLQSIFEISRNKKLKRKQRNRIERLLSVKKFEEFELTMKILGQIKNKR